MATDWIIVNYGVQPAVQECLRCGQTTPMPFNVSLEYALDVMRAWIKAHRKCSPAPAEQGKGE